MFKQKFQESEDSAKSLNFTARKKESDRIERENMSLAQRLLVSPSCINFREMDRDFDEHKKHKKLLQKVKLRVKSSNSAAVLPPLKTAVTSPTAEQQKEDKEEIPIDIKAATVSEDAPYKGRTLFITGEGEDEKQEQEQAPAETKPAETLKPAADEGKVAAEKKKTAEIKVEVVGDKVEKKKTGTIAADQIDKAEKKKSETHVIEEKKENPVPVIENHHQATNPPEQNTETGQKQETQNIAEKAGGDTSGHLFS